MSSWNPDVYRTFSPSDCHWSLCREFIDRHRHLFPEEQVVALAHSYASSQLMMAGEVDQMSRLVPGQLPAGTEPVPTGKVESSCWEREAEPEFRKTSLVLESEISKMTYLKPVQLEFDRLGLGRLVVIDHVSDLGHCRAVIAVKTSEKQFSLSVALGSTVKKAKQRVKKAFLREMKQVCYQIVSKNPFPGNEIARREDPAKQIEYYRSIMETFSKLPIKQDLTFSKEFTQVEREELKRIALELNLTTCIVGPKKNRKLKIMGRTIPALAVVERIVVHKDPELCELYSVVTPSVVLSGS
ncbi:hypothetical protein pipiens_016980 [Culex pipiens pipiens]|uniref:XRN2-binding (XTBD) domain-containing protein n=1 Tax=Culex pipiens pipiens TaxID=38569 RepID=A0ABD1CIQ1_CULPP